ncbi:dynamin family protein [Nonomuraea sp. NPDC049158]|uniref:dynamin family protein n=1 Tax=Nonomuraea sp. NPDC049158 TaxID=3155649 RepID=UPI00340343B5
MNTAMDDGRQESPGEQTLSFRAFTDESAAPPAASAADEEGPVPASASAGEPADSGASPSGDEPSDEGDKPSDEPEAPSDEPEALSDEQPSAEPEAPSDEQPSDEPEALSDEPEVPSDEQPSGEPEALSDEEALGGAEASFDEEPSGDAEALSEAEAWAELMESAALSDPGGGEPADDDLRLADDEPEGPAAVRPEPSAWHFPDPQAEQGSDDSRTGQVSDAQAVHAEPVEPAAPARPVGAEQAAVERPPVRRVEPLPPEMVAALTAALDALRESVTDLRFGLDLPGAAEARQARADLLAQLKDYVLPRVRTNTAPALIVVAGSTGAGKSTLVNSLAEKNISRTGVRRPTTGIPVLVCHPDDRQWFTKGDLLGGMRRIDKPSPEDGIGSLVVVATEKLPQGVALLDTPDIDSVVEEHHEIAHRMLDAADLWIFVTTAARYADAPAWNLLRLAKERGARLAIVLSRVQPKAREVVLKHFGRMLSEYGLGEVDRFVIGETKVVDGRLPDHEMTDLRLWLAELSVDEDRRAQAVHETLNGVLDSFRTRVPALARHLEGQVAFRTELRADVEAAYMSALAEIDKATRNGMLVHGEVLARWQDFAGSGDLMRTIQFRKRGRSGRQAPERVTAFRAALRAGLESVIVAAAHRAAEEVVARWRHRSELGGTIGAGLERPSDELVRHATRAIAAWQEHVTELVRTEGVAKRSVSKFVSFDADSLSLIFMVAMFSGGTVEGVPHRLVNALLGAESLRGIGAKALSDLRARIGMLFDEESMRYVQALDSAGIPDESTATRLYQATYNLEVAR